MGKIFKNISFQFLGTIGVDAGLVWIGDPCYILHEKLPKTLGNTWSEFCDFFNEKEHLSFNYDRGHEGLGVCTSTKHGDGSYPVIGVFDEDDKRPSAVIIDFDDVFGTLKEKIISEFLEQCVKI